MSRPTCSDMEFVPNDCELNVCDWYFSYDGMHWKDHPTLNYSTKIKSYIFLDNMIRRLIPGGVVIFNELGEQVLHGGRVPIPDTDGTPRLTFHTPWSDQYFGLFRSSENLLVVDE